MTEDEHRSRAMRLMTSAEDLASVDSEDHFEARIELYVHAMTHCFNIILHKSGIRSPSQDQLHSDMPSDLHLEVLNLDLEYLEALRELELLRTLCVRGNVPYSADLSQKLKTIGDLFAPFIS